MKRPPSLRRFDKPRREGISRHRKSAVDSGAGQAGLIHPEQDGSGQMRPRVPKGMRRLRIAVVLVLGLSLVQYLDTGTVRWPLALYHTFTRELGEYATRPDAGWRRAAEVLEGIGARREGAPAPAFDLSGRVVRIADGDTVSILDAANAQHKVRLFGIDTPERDQPFGKAARNALSQLVDEKPVGVVIVTTDSYGRKVGTLYRDGININAAMVASGYAWWYQHYAPHERKLAVSEQQARDQRLGLWADPHPVPPWNWRRGQR